MRAQRLLFGALLGLAVAAAPQAAAAQAPAATHPGEYAPADIAYGSRLYDAQCTTCHGADLMGLGPVPGIAGRSPSYLVRQLYDMQAGNRHGQWTELMKPVVEKLTSDDMIAIAAYTSSRPVAATTSQAKK